MRTPNNGGEWGILGGAFNPVHRGHIALASDIRAAKDSDGVLLVPSYIPPRKTVTGMADFEDRVRMLELAIADDPALQISRIESESDTPGYTLLTVQALKKRYPDVSFYFIIGADLLAEFSGWYEAEEILKELPVAVGSRPGADLHLPDNLPQARFTVYGTRLLDIASRDIRAAVAAGITEPELAKLVPEQVADYILERGLYK